MKFSLVTPSFNQGRYLARTIESILSQSHGDLELFVMDNASTDNTREVLESCRNDKRLQWISETDRGQSHAINKGLAKLSGDVFNWINADDYLANDALATVAKAFSREGTRVVTGGCQSFASMESREKNLALLRLSIPQSVEEGLLDINFCQPPTFWKTADVRELGGVAESLHYVMDLHLWWKYLLRFGLRGIVLIPETLAHFRVHPEAKSSTSAAKFEWETLAIHRQLLGELHQPAFIGEALQKQGSSKTNLPVMQIQTKLDVPYFIHLLSQRYSVLLGSVADELSVYLWHLQLNAAVRSKLHDLPPFYQPVPALPPEDGLSPSATLFSNIKRCAVIQRADYHISCFIVLASHQENATWEIRLRPLLSVPRKRATAKSNPLPKSLPHFSRLSMNSLDVTLGIGLQRLTITCRDPDGRLIDQSSHWIFRIPALSGIRRRIGDFRQRYLTKDDLHLASEPRQV